MQYERALSKLKSPLLDSLPLARYLRGLVLLNREEDWGDTAAFWKAVDLWSGLWKEAPPSRLDKADPVSDSLGRTENQGELVRALAGLQWAAAEQFRGHAWKSASLSLKAREKLKPLRDCPEAEAALALFEYYRGSLLSSLPFISVDPNRSLARLDSSAALAGRLGPLFRTAWIWMIFDQKQYDKGLKAIDRYLTSFPGHRLYRQMEGDFEFHRGQTAKALEVYRGVRDTYALDTLWRSENRLPLGYLAACGNLARIHAALGHRDSTHYYLALWRDPKFEKAQPWLPASLKKALKSL